MKNISGIVPVILAAVVGIGAVVSLSDYTAPVYGSESEDELTETETIRKCRYGVGRRDGS